MKADKQLTGVFVLLREGVIPSCVPITEFHIGFLKNGERSIVHRLIEVGREAVRYTFSNSH